MHTSKLLQLLKVFSPEEMRRFRKFIKSPYHNANPRLEQLFQLLRPHYPDFEDARLDKAKVFSKLFPRKKYQDAKMRKILSAMVEQVETFLAVEKIEENRFLKKKLFAQSMGERSAFIPFQRMMVSLIKELEGQAVKDMDYYLEQFQLNFNMYFHPMTDKRQLSNEYLPTAIDYLDYFFVMAKVRLLYECQSRKSHLASEESFFLGEAIQIAIKENFQHRSPLFQLYHLIGEFFKETPTLRDLIAIRTKFEDCLPLMQLAEQKAILPFLINISNRELVKGKQEFLSEIFEILKFGVQHNLLIEHQIIPPSYYLNIVSTGTSLGAFDWVEQFIENYQQYLEENEREVLTALGKAILLFEKGYFQTCLLELNQLPNEVKKYEWRLRVIYIQCVYELVITDETYIDLLLARVEALKKFISRNKLMSDSRKTAYLNFCNVVVYFSDYFQLGTLQINTTHIARTKLENSSPLISKSWLMKKLIQLEVLKN